MAYVSDIPATIPTYIWAKINKNWNIEKIENKKETEPIKDRDYRNRMLLKESYLIASLVAYKNSNIKYEIKDNKIYITYIDKKAKTNLKVQDHILTVDSQKIKDKNHLMSYIKSKNINDEIKFKVIHNKKTVNKKAKLININNEPKVGALITENFKIKTNKPVKYNYKSSESGPSGGLMLSLTIYSHLNKIDITHGKKIAGTGTIDIDGYVGEISGVKQKLIGAIRNKADIFLVPKGSNYKEAKKIKNKNHYKIELIPVETFEEALKKLK